MFMSTSIYNFLLNFINYQYTQHTEQKKCQEKFH